VTTQPREPFEVLTMGRIGVDMYPLQIGRSLRHVERFGKYLGGSATNVAVAAARYGRRAAVISRTGQDPFGDYIHDALTAFKVDDRFVTAVPSPRAAARALHEAGIKLAIIKQGPAGVLASDGAQIVEVPPVPVKVVNGLGAGDAFGGALCHSLLSGWDLERTLRFCNAAGAVVASRLACADAMPTAAEVEAIMRPSR
jgi:sugar/nucleoside kinase (ribokinase family)